LKYIRTTDDSPLPRYSHYSTLISDKRGKSDKILIFAGRGISSAVYRDVWVFDLKKGEWYELPIAGEGPSGRYGFAAFIDDGEMFVFGGFNGSTEVYSDIWALNYLSTKRKWRKLDMSQTPGNEFLERYHHTVTKTPEGIIVFGGRRADHTMCLYVELGTDRGKFIRMSKKVSQIKTLTLKSNWSGKLLQTWIKRIYFGLNSTHSSPKIAEEYLAFQKQYEESISSNAVFKQRILNLAVDTGIFPDIRFQLSDKSVVSCHRAFLLSNIQETLSILRLDKDAILNSTPETVIPLPFTHTEFTALKPFLYAHQVDLTLENVWNMLEISLRMGSRDRLSQLCESFIYVSRNKWGTYEIIKKARLVGSKELEKFGIWDLSVNFAKHREELEYLQLPEDVQLEVETNQWPGVKYNMDNQAFLAQREKDKPTNCLVQ